MTSTSAQPGGARVSRRYVAVFDDRSAASRVAARLQSAGLAADDLRVGDSLDALASVRGEMQEEINHVPRVPVPLPREAARGVGVGVIVGGVVGVTVALPFASISFGDLGVGARLLILAVVGAVFGGFVGAFIGGAFGIKRPDEPVAAAEGTTLAVPATREARAVLLESGARRIDLIGADGQPITTVASDDPGATAIFHQIAQHAREETRPD
jgi:hypothetical protein